MQGIRARFAVVVGALGIIGCSDDTAHSYLANRKPPNTVTARDAAPTAPTAQTHAGPAATLTPADWEERRAQVIATVDSVDRKLRRVRALSRQEKTDLRRD